MSSTVLRRTFIGTGAFGIAAIIAFSYLQDGRRASDGGAAGVRPEQAEADGGAELQISEVMASNGTTIADDDGEFHDWIEIYNAGHRTVSLGGFHLSDDEDNLTAWRFPAAELGAGEALLVWASGKDTTDRRGEFHANFKIDRDGEPLFLTAPDGTTVVDFVPATSIPRDVSFGRPGNAAGKLCFFTLPTPGTQNPAYCYEQVPEPAEEPAPPIFSHEPGFYPENFELSILSGDPDVVVLYTLDGSEPRMEAVGGHVGYFANVFFPGESRESRQQFIPKVSTPYEGPILIEDRSYTPKRDEIGISQVITAYARDYGVSWQAPREKIFRGSAISARTYKSGVYSDIVTASFFVLPGGKPRYSIPVISTVTDPEGLFGFRDGIYVPGQGYFSGAGDEFNYARAGEDGKDLINYNLSGREAERPINMEVFDPPSGHLAYSKRLGIRVHGGGSRMRPLKGLRLYARKSYDGAETINHDFFSELKPPVENAREGNRRLILRAGGDSWNLTDDLVATDLFLHTNVDAARGNPAVHFINGEFWSLVNVRERIDEHFFAKHYGLDPDSITILNNVAGFAVESNLESGPPEEIKHFNDLLRYADSHDLANPEHFATVASALNIESYIDYYIHFIFLANVDWEGAKHFRFWRARCEDGSYSQWRVAIWDFDLAFGRGSTLNMLQLALDPSGTVDFHDRDLQGDPSRSLLIRALLENESFRQQFINRFADLMNTIYSSEHMIKSYARRFEAVHPYIAEHVSRWEGQFSRMQVRRRYQLMDRYLPGFLRGWGTGSVLEKNRIGPGVMKFMRERPGEQRKHIIEWFKLDGLAEVHIGANQEHGYVRINSIGLQEETGGVHSPGAWRGFYFLSVPVEIAAAAKPGYRFERWETIESVDALSDRIILNPRKEIRMHANFSSVGR